jgi:arginase
MHLVDGAEAIAGDLPRASTARVEVPASAGEALDTGIRRFSALSRSRGARSSPHEGRRRRRRRRRELPRDRRRLRCRGARDRPCRARALDDLAVVWFDAHGDLNTPRPRRRARSPAWRCAR